MRNSDSTLSLIWKWLTSWSWAADGFKVACRGLCMNHLWQLNLLSAIKEPFLTLTINQCVSESAAPIWLHSLEFCLFISNNLSNNQVDLLPTELWTLTLIWQEIGRQTPLKFAAVFLTLQFFLKHLFSVICQLLVSPGDAMISQFVYTPGMCHQEPETSSWHAYQRFTSAHCFSVWVHKVRFC